MEPTPEIVEAESWLGRPIRLDRSLAIFAGIVLLTVLTRFAALGDRVMSHDETTHVYFSWQLEQGRGYAHDPLSHGPVQFHLLALSYYLFGDNDASARIPVALSGVAAVLLIWPFRRWIGKTSAVVTAALIFASPFLLYYSRYARNEAYVVVEALVMFWAVFDYLERRRTASLFLLAGALSMHFSTKETAFIYAAQLLIVLAVLFLGEVLRREWERGSRRLLFLVGVAAAGLGGGLALVIFLRDRTLARDAATLSTSPLVAMGVVLALAASALAIAMLVLNFGRRLRTDFPALDLLVVTGTLTLTQLGALPAAALGWDPLAYSDPAQWGRTAAMVALVVLLAAGVGLSWNWRRWLPAAGIFFAIYIPLHTTLFTNPQGIATGMVGSLGYWLVQQGVQRGTQPLYYYLLIEIPIYEYLAAVGALLAGGWGIAALIREVRGDRTLSAPPSAEGGHDLAGFYPLFFGYWSVTSLVLYTYAGERMPWLTVHIALPMLLLAGWAFGRILSRFDAGRLRQARTWILIALVALGLLSLSRFFGFLLGAPRPFGGMELDQLRATTGAITTLAVGLAAGFAALRLRAGWSERELARLTGVVVLFGLFGLTLRASLRASFVNYDYATEFLVYAHSADGPKMALAQIEEISRRTSGGGLDLELGYDNETTYPFWWYLRNYPNARYFADTPSRDILNYSVILAGQGNWGKVEAILRDRYYVYEYNRVWWPMQDYFDLTFERIREALTSAEYRRALWDIWFDRDYTRYGTLVNRDFSLRGWSPAEKLRLYVRKDVAAQVWNYGVAPAVLQPVALVDPYAAQMIVLPADRVVGSSGTGGGQFSLPRGLAVAPDGTVYVADTNNHRVQHLAPDGTVLHTWGSFAVLGPETEAPGGTFNEPWGIAVGPDGTVYVADTWNHRVQRFSPTGRYLGMWGSYGQADSQTSFWGPRGIAVDSQSRVYVSDTGNKRVIVFDADGTPLGQIGDPGGGPLSGQLDEPVGVAIGPDGLVYVADTWNSRIQAFAEVEPNVWQPAREWILDAWLTSSLDNKPYLSAGERGTVCVTDPEGYRVLCFTSEGEFVAGWGSPGADFTQFGLPVGIAFDSACGLWVSDTNSDRLMHFTLPECP